MTTDPHSTSESQSESGLAILCEADSWALFERGLFVVERPVEPAGHRVLVSKLYFCREPGCDCREVGFTGALLDVAPDEGRVELTAQRLDALFGDAELMNGAVELDFGTVKSRRSGTAPLSPDWIEFVQSQIDGELLDQLHELWLLAKGFKPRAPETLTWSRRDPAELVAWHEAHPGARHDRFVDEDKTFVAAELYCVKPDCTCAEAIVDFAELYERDRARSIGYVRVGLPELNTLEVKGPRARVERLWAAFRARHRKGGERFVRRKRRMAELAMHQSNTPVQARADGASRAGRNDPCPCGSGKKFKRCCGGRGGPA